MAYLPWYAHRPPEEWPSVPQRSYEKFPARLQQLLERSAERTIDHATAGH